MEDLMRKILIVIALSCGLFLALGQASWAESSSRIGAGMHYWMAIDDIDVDDVDEDGLALIISYQYRPAGLINLELDVEIQDKGYAGSVKDIISPQAYILVGSGVYAGAGVGINYSDGTFANDPFFALRVGIDMEVLPTIFLDINANYRFEKWDSDKIEDDIDTDTVTLGAILRIEF